jgi:hypothetical protein
LYYYSHDYLVLRAKVLLFCEICKENRRFLGIKG